MRMVAAHGLGAFRASCGRRCRQVEGTCKQLIHHLHGIVGQALSPLSPKAASYEDVTMKNRLRLAAALMILTAVPAGAAEELVLNIDRSQLLNVTTPPGAIVIGDPFVVDVTVQGQQIFVHGRAYGETDMVILDTQGNQIANFEVLVKESSSNHTLSVYKAGKRYSSLCLPDCQSVVRVGDDPGYMGATAGSLMQKQGLAQGRSTPVAVSAPPPTPTEGANGSQ